MATNSPFEEGRETLVLRLRDKVEIVLPISIVIFLFGILTLQGYIDQNTTLRFPWLWPLVFTTASLLSILWIIKPRNRMLYRLSGSVLTTAMIMRGVTIFYQFAVLEEEFLDTSWRNWMAVLSYLLLGYLIYWIYRLLWFIHPIEDRA